MIAKKGNKLDLNSPANFVESNELQDITLAKDVPINQFTNYQSSISSHDNNCLSGIGIKYKKEDDKRLESVNNEQSNLNLKPSIIKGDSRKNGLWTKEEQQKFLEALEIHGNLWLKVANYVGTRNPAQVRSHAQKHFTKLIGRAIKKAKNAKGRKKIFAVTRLYLNRIPPPKSLFELYLEATYTEKSKVINKGACEERKNTEEKPSMLHSEHLKTCSQSLPIILAPKPIYPVFYTPANYYSQARDSIPLSNYMFCFYHSNVNQFPAITPTYNP